MNNIVRKISNSLVIDNIIQFSYILILSMLNIVIYYPYYKIIENILITSQKLQCDFIMIDKDDNFNEWVNDAASLRFVYSLNERN